MVKKAIKETIHAKGIDIGIYTTDFENEFISLTDIAKFRNEDDPRFVIQNWMRNRNTIEFLAVWEELHNPDFNRVQFEAVKTEAGLNRFVMTPAKWIEQMNAIGIISKAGRYGGTFAHSDIAMSFATWISPEFQLFIMKDYRRLKFDENSRLSLNWNLNREIAKLNYRIHTDTIKENGGSFNTSYTQAEGLRRHPLSEPISGSLSYTSAGPRPVCFLFHRKVRLWNKKPFGGSHCGGKEDAAYTARRRRRVSQAKLFYNYKLLNRVFGQYRYSRIYISLGNRLAFYCGYRCIHTHFSHNIGILSHAGYQRTIFD
ncbi:KilA-N domain-containing protein [Diplocloster agilis]|uniref:KilA-N domain-containing protein n=1 Tax=Diplocloster agilis TaxID=2850323 RepID=UPI001EE7E1D8|nr:KilA-N domain-containing protein [Diplocloster agilis]